MPVLTSQSLGISGQVSCLEQGSGTFQEITFKGEHFPSAGDRPGPRGPGSCYRSRLQGLLGPVVLGAPWLPSLLWAPPSWQFCLSPRRWARQEPWHGPRGPLGTILPPRAALTPSHPTSPLAPPAGAGRPGHDSGGGCLPAPAGQQVLPPPRVPVRSPLRRWVQSGRGQTGRQVLRLTPLRSGLWAWGHRWAPPSLTAHQHPRPRPLMSAWVARVTETPPAGPTACQSPGPLKDPALWTAAARPL